MFLKSYEERVATGAALLDKINPNWYTRIDSGSLDLLSTRYCVLGQIYGSYSKGLDELYIDTGGYSQGFIIFRFWNHLKIEELWREQIATRRARDLNARRILETHAPYSKTRV